MEINQVLKSLTKSTSISMAVVTLSIGFSIMVTFFLCFIQEKSCELPFNLAKIKTEQDGAGYFTTMKLGNGIWSVSIIGFLILSVLLFLIFYFLGKSKTKKK